MHHPALAEKFVNGQVQRLARFGAVAGSATVRTGSHAILIAHNAHNAQQCRIFHCRVGHGDDLVEIE
jgi:hypothetical protein